MTKPADKLPRIGIVTTRAVVERLNELCGRYELSQNRVIEALLAHVDDASLTRAVEALKAAKAAEEATRAAVMKEVNELSPEDLSKLISLIKNEGVAKS